MHITPAWHAAFLAGATIVALLFAGIILARNSRSTAARMHAIYGGLAAWWFFCMAMVASTDDLSKVDFWVRVVQIGIGMLAGVFFHLNAATAGLAHQYQARIRTYYTLSCIVTLLGLTNPYLFESPRMYAWGYYPSYTIWGLLILLLLAAAFIDVVLLYRRALLSDKVGKAHKQKLRAFYHGNMMATVALVDFLPAFGVGVYPFGFAVMTAMHIATVFGAIRYRLIEITPEFATSQILQTIPDGVVVLDTQGLVRLINPTAKAMIGLDGPNIANRVFAGLAPKPLVEVIGQSAPELPIEVSFETSNGRPYTVRLSANELQDQDGEPVGHVWLLHDVTQQRQVEAEKRELEIWVRHGQKLETLGVMAGGVAHDFNNILAAILGSADLARTRVSDPLLIEHLDTIISSTERAAELTSQMLTYAGQSSSALERPLDINSLCREISELLHSAVSRKANFTMSFAPELPLVMADRGQMTQVIVNLINNASEALDDGVGDIRLRTRIMDLEDSDISAGTVPHVVVEVIDTGHGMDNETRDRMFDPFFTTKFTGRGLGLASVMGIVDSHGGRIRVDSKPGVGTTFTIALPLTEAAVIQPSQNIKKGNWRGQGIALVADDEPEVRRVTGRMLARMGFEFAEAAHGKEALAIFSAHQDEVSLILLDMTMPEMDGLATHQQIRVLSEDIPIILMSGYAQSQIVETAPDRHTGFIMKPFLFSTLELELQNIARD